MNVDILKWLIGMDYSINVMLLIITGIAVDKIASIISSGKIFDPLRNAIAKRAYPDDPTAAKRIAFWSWLHKLVTCSECVGIWVSMPACLLPIIVCNHPVLLAPIEVFAVAWVASCAEVIRRGRLFVGELTVKTEAPIEVLSHQPVYSDGDDECSKKLNA